MFHESAGASHLERTKPISGEPLMQALMKWLGNVRLLPRWGVRRDVRRVTIIQGHPDSRRPHFAHALAEAYAAGALEAGREVNVIDVASLDFPLLRNGHDLEHGAPPEAIQHAQSAILRSDHLVMMYPVWNGATPALLKGFLEQTFRPAFIFPDAEPGEPMGLVAALRQRKAMQGKTARIVVTMQMPAFVYRWYFHPHPEKITLRLSGLGPIRETLIGRVDAMNEADRQRWLDRMYAFGRKGL
jgi:putative NADPH-quinone reductase